MARRPYRTRTRKRIGASFGRFSIQASNESDQWFRDGEDATTTVSPVVNTTNALIVGTYGDFVAGSITGSGWSKSKPLVKRWIFNATISPSEANNQTGRIVWQWWLMVANQVVGSDWVLNGRDPNDVTLAVTNAAFPHRLLKTGFTTMQVRAATESIAAVQFPARIKADVKFRRPLRLNFPENLYFMMKPIIEDDAAGAWAAGEVQLTWNTAVLVAPTSVST